MPKDRPNRRVGAFRKTQQAIDYVVTHAGKFSGDAFRFANAGYASEDVLISGDGAMQHGGRWNPRGEFLATYLALDVETAWAEKVAQFSALRAAARILSSSLPGVDQGQALSGSRPDDGQPHRAVWHHCRINDGRAAPSTGRREASSNAACPGTAGAYRRNRRACCAVCTQATREKPRRVSEESR